MPIRAKPAHLKAKREDHISSPEQRHTLIHMDTDKSGVENLRGRGEEKTDIEQNIIWLPKTLLEENSAMERLSIT